MNNVFTFEVLNVIVF